MTHSGAHSSLHACALRCRYEVPKAMGIFRTIPSHHSDLTVDKIVGRIQGNHERMQSKIERKMASERAYYVQRYGLAES